jgi:hypothetical protein
MSAQAQRSRIRFPWTSRRIALEFIYRLHKGQMDAALLASLLARMKKDIDRRFHPSQAKGEYAGRLKQFLFLIHIYAAAMVPLLEAMAEGARLVTSTLTMVEFGKVGPRGRLAALVDAHNQLLLRLAIMEKILLKHSLIAAVPQGTLGALVGLQAHVLFTCRLLTEERMENIGLLLDYETLMQQAEDDLERLESSAHQAAGKIKLGETARSICEKEVTMVSRYRDLADTTEGVITDLQQQLDTWESASRQNHRRTRPSTKLKDRPKSRPKKPVRRRNKK